MTTVREQSTLTFTADAHTATLVSADGKTNETFAVTGAEEFRKINRGILILTGPSTESGKPVDQRVTLTLRRNLFTWLKETRPAGAGDFQFRDQYTLTRSLPPTF